MLSTSKTKLLTELLNLESVQVIKYKKLPQVGLILYTEAQSKKATCIRCGNKSQNLHQNHRYLIKDLPISGQSVYLRINRRQFKCDNCGKPFSEELNFVKKRRKYTSRLAMEIVKQVLADDIKTVAQNNDVSAEEIETMLKDKTKELKQEKSSRLKKLRNNDFGNCRPGVLFRLFNYSFSILNHDLLEWEHFHYYIDRF